MQRISLILFGFLVVGTVAHQSVAAFNDPILKEIKPRTITIIGETHQQKESIWFFQSRLYLLNNGQYRSVGRIFTGFEWKLFFHFVAMQNLTKILLFNSYRLYN